MIVWCGHGEGRHLFTPWVNERWKPELDTRVCRNCKTYEKRKHLKGTEMFPQWLAEEITNAIQR